MESQPHSPIRRKSFGPTTPLSPNPYAPDPQASYPPAASPGSTLLRTPPSSHASLNSDSSHHGGSYVGSVPGPLLFGGSAPGSPGRGAAAGAAGAGGLGGGGAAGTGAPVYAGGYGTIGAHLRAHLKLNESDGTVQYVDDDGVAMPSHAGMFSTVVNLTNTIMGSGILTLPFALRCAGWAGGSGILAFAMVMSVWSFWVLTLAVQTSAKFSFRGMVETILGHKAGVVAQGSIIAYTSFASIGYLVLLGDFLTSALGYWLSPGSLFLNRKFVIAMMGCLLLPFAFLSSLHALRHTSVFGVAAILYVVFVIVYLFFTKYDHHVNDTVEVLNDTPRFFLAFPLIVISFTAQFNLPTFYRELDQRSPQRMMICVVATLALCFVVYATAAFFGYMSFGKATVSDILESYPRSNEFVLAARLAMAINILSTYPLVNHALRENFQDMFIDKAQHSQRKLTLISIVSTLVFAGVAIIVPNIGVVVDYNGSINGITIVYMLPALCYWYISRGSSSKIGRSLAIFALGVGVVCGVLGIVFTTLNLVDQTVLDK